MWTVGSCFSLRQDRASKLPEADEVVLFLVCYFPGWLQLFHGSMLVCIMGLDVVINSLAVNIKDPIVNILCAVCT